MNMQDVHVFCELLANADTVHTIELSFCEFAFEFRYIKPNEEKRYADIRIATVNESMISSDI